MYRRFYACSGACVLLTPQSQREAELERLTDGKVRELKKGAGLLMIGKLRLLHHKQKEEPAQDDTATYQHFFDHAVEGIFRTTPDGTYLQANPALAHIYGYDSPEELKNSITNIAQQLYVQPRERETFTRLLEQHDSVSGFESQVYRKDGSLIWISENAWAVRDENGNLLFYEGSVSDITARKQREEALQQSEAKHRLLLNIMPDFMFLVHRNGICVNCTTDREHELFPPANELLGNHIEEVLPTELAQSTLNHMMQVLTTSTMQTFEYQLFLDTAIYDYEIRMVPASTDEVLAIVRDITTRKKAERLKNEFVSIVSHELRTPLTSIRGSLSLIVGSMAKDLSPKVLKMVEIAHKNSERLVSLVNDILDIDKIESGKMVFHLKPVELIPLIEQAIESTRAYGDQYGVRFVLTHDLDGVKVNADSDRLIQVLTNLLSNAAKFSPSDSEVQVTVKRKGKSLLVSVQDFGSGIPEEFRGRMFQKFAQADSSATRQKGGSGLGLNISKAIVERHKGTIGFETETNVGSTFFFELPEWREQEITVESKHHQQRILICEDTPDLAKMLSIMLSMSGFNTDIAYNTTQAKQFLAANQYAAMTLDLVMPGQSGIDFIRELRSQDSTRHLPIVVFSAIAQQGQQELEGGAFEVADWLDKTADHQTIVASIRQAISQRHAERSRILHVEDDSDVALVLAEMVQDFADITQAHNIQEAKQKIQAETFSLIILDMSLPDGSGMDLFSFSQSHNKLNIPILIFSAREISQEVAQKVTAALVKSRTSNQELLDVIKSLIH